MTGEDLASRTNQSPVHRLTVANACNEAATD
jgi:hypothetical protein